MIKCIIFDCDGTLVDSELLCSQALESEFSRYGIPYPAEQMMYKYRGVKLNRILSELSTEHSVTLDEDFEETYRSQLNTLFERDLRACEGAETALNILSQSTLKMCVASSGPLTKMKKSLSLTGLDVFFNGQLFSSYDLGVWKPEPDIFLHAAKEMGFKPSECLVVEDSEVGVQAALRAGMLCVHYSAHRHNNYDAKAQYTLSNLAELPEVFDTFN